MPYSDPDKQREYQRRWARRKQRRVKRHGIDLLGGECVDCGEDAPDLLEFDHIDPEAKRFGIVSGYSRAPEDWYRELSKCVLRCATCHRRKSKKNGEFHPSLDVAGGGAA